jgi:hypothetical protein
VSAVAAQPARKLDPTALVRLRPAIWLETHGYIRDASGKKHRPRVNVLQRRIEAAYIEAQITQRPLRTIGLKPRKRGYSTMVAAIHHAQINNFQHEGVIIGNKLDTSDTVFRMMSFFAKHDEFRPRWGSAFTETTERITYQHGARVIQDTAKNGESIRGMTPQFIHGTEMAHWENADEVLVALLNAIQRSFPRVDAEGCEWRVLRDVAAGALADGRRMPGWTEKLLETVGSDEPEPGASGGRTGGVRLRADLCRLV